MPEAVKNLIVLNVNDVEHVASQVDFVFSAVDMTKDEIKKIEEAYAKTETPVVSNNSAHRWTPDVPMMVPEINPEHVAVIESQTADRNSHAVFIVDIQRNLRAVNLLQILNKLFGRAGKLQSLRLAGKMNQTVD